MRTRRSFQPRFVILFVSLLVVYVSVITVRTLLKAGEFQGRDRINIVLYGKTPLVLSLGLTDAVSYIVPFENDYKVRMPGGYGQYPIGSLGKLSALEHNPELLRQTFSSIVSAHVSYVFIPKKTVIYFDTHTNDTFSPSKTALLQAIISPGYSSNADIVDKAFLFANLLTRTKIDFIQLKSTFLKPDSKDFSEKAFFDYYQGFFYEKSLRDERTELRIEYSTSYQAAKTLSRILEGQGIRVVDITRVSGTPEKCSLGVDERTMKTYTTAWFIKRRDYPESARFIEKLFNCDIRSKRLDSVDEKLTLGSILEAKWK